MKCIIVKPYFVVVSEQSVSNMVPNMDTKDIIIITRFHFSIICILRSLHVNVIHDSNDVLYIINKITYQQVSVSVCLYAIHPNRFSYAVRTHIARSNNHIVQNDTLP